MRSMPLLLVGFALLAGAILLATSWAAEKEGAAKDPFVGDFIKYGRWESRTGTFNEAPELSITKEGDIYRLSKPYETFKFKLVKDGEISDGAGGIGTIYFGTAQYADGHKVRVLRAEFCYERFILYERDEAQWGRKKEKK